MGIRYEKDTLLNWVEELGKFLRLVVDKYNAFDEHVEANVLEEGYQQYFQKDRQWFLALSEEDLVAYVNNELKDDQVRSLGLLFFEDAKFCVVDTDTKKIMYGKAKLLLNYASNQLGQFSFEDYGILAEIDSELLK